MNVIIWSVFIFIFICAGLAIYKYVQAEDAKEHFTSAPQNLEITIIDIYNEILNREPTAAELIQDTRDINANKLTFEGLRQRMMDSEEYSRLIKTQSNSLTPELQKVISDRTLIQKIKQIYQEERNKTIPEKMVLPLKDVYIWLNYNEYAFRAFLRNKEYANFEEDVQRIPQLDKDMLEKMLSDKFSKDDLNTQGVQIAKEMQKPGSTVETEKSIVGASETCSARTVEDTDSDMSPMVNGIMNNADKIFNKDEVAKLLDTQAQEAQIPVQTHYGQMTLRADQSWTVPQRPPPVCTTLGQKPLIQPMMNNSKLLLGTSLEDAEDTSVGSIMPKFEYKEYIPVKVM